MMQVLDAGWMPMGQAPQFGSDKQGFFATGLADAVTYVGGMPVGLISTGLVVGGQSGEIEVVAADLSSATPGNSSNFIGLLFNNCLIDTRRGSGQKNLTYDIHDALPSIVKTPCYVKLWMGQTASTDFPVSHDVIDDRAPFLADAWAIADPIFIEESATAADNGRLTKNIGTVNTAPIGRVWRAPASASDYMIAEFWNIPSLQVKV